jgi:hypothetical protein
MMMSAEELRQRATDLRLKRATAGDELLAAIEADVSEYRAVRDAHPRQIPPDYLVARLPLMGWLIYEATWNAVQRVQPAYEFLGGEREAASRAAAGLIARVAEAARALPWPEFAPRALGALRAQALAASKRDTQAGYDEAWLHHHEVSEKHNDFVQSHAGEESRAPYLLALDEVLLQLALAETGTACRTAERVVGRWSEGLDEASWTGEDEEYWIARMFRELTDGIKIGERALDVAAKIDREYGFVSQVDEHRLAMHTSYQNPGIMTARAVLLALAMSAEMERMGRLMPDETPWDVARTDLLGRFLKAYRSIEKDVLNDADEPQPPKFEHLRSIIQIRLNLALLAPGYPLPSRWTFVPCLALDPLDDAAVEAMSTWLSEAGDGGRQRGDANVIGSATMPAFITSVEACRALLASPAYAVAHQEVTGGYRDWRRRWFVLDRHAAETGRRERVEKRLGPLDDAS